MTVIATVRTNMARIPERTRFMVPLLGARRYEHIREDRDVPGRWTPSRGLPGVFPGSSRAGDGTAGVLRSDAIPLDSGLMIRRGRGARCGEPGSVHVPVSVLAAVPGNTVAPGNEYQDQVLFILREGDPSHDLPRVCP